MTAADFRAEGLQTLRIISSGSGPSNAKLLIYQIESANDNVGGINPNAFDLNNIGNDIFLFVSGAKASTNGATNGITAFGGDVLTSGSFTVLGDLTSSNIVYGNTRIDLTETGGITIDPDGSSPLDISGSGADVIISTNDESLFIKAIKGEGGGKLVLSGTENAGESVKIYGGADINIDAIGDLGVTASNITIDAAIDLNLAAGLDCSANVEGGFQLTAAGGFILEGGADSKIDLTEGDSLQIYLGDVNLTLSRSEGGQAMRLVANEPLELSSSDVRLTGSNNVVAYALNNAFMVGQNNLYLAGGDTATVAVGNAQLVLTGSSAKLQHDGGDLSIVENGQNQFTSINRIRLEAGSLGLELTSSATEGILEVGYDTPINFKLSGSSGKKVEIYSPKNLILEGSDSVFVTGSSYIGISASGDMGLKIGGDLEAIAADSFDFTSTDFAVTATDNIELETEQTTFTHGGSSEMTLSGSGVDTILSASKIRITGSLEVERVFSTPITLTPASTVTLDLSLGSSFQMELNQEMTMSLAGATDGMVGNLLIVHDETISSYGIAWSSDFFRRSSEDLSHSNLSGSRDLYSWTILDSGKAFIVRADEFVSASI